jgi:hypothetical protein
MHYAGDCHERIRLPGHVPGRQAGRPRPIPRQGPSHRQHRQQMWFYLAVPRPGSRVPRIARPRPGSSGLPLQLVRLAGAGHGRGDWRLLQGKLRRQLPDVRRGRHQRRQRGSAVDVLEGRSAECVGHRKHQMELHQIPDRARQPGRQALYADHQAGRDCGQYREVAGAVNVVRLIGRAGRRQDRSSGLTGALRREAGVSTSDVE